MWINTATELSGSARRIFMAQVVELIGWGGQRFAESVLGWDRKTIRKEQKEIQSGSPYIDGRRRSGRKKAEAHFPQLLDDIDAVVGHTGQTDPTFKSTRVYIPITAKEVRRRLIDDKGYRSREIIGERSLRTKLNELGYRLKRIKKCLPLKRIEETDAIFDEVHRINQEADEQAGVLRISLDTKAAVKVGRFSRNGQSRTPQAALDHDFDPDTTLTPFGILLPQQAKSYLWFTESKVTADFMVDCIEQMWGKIENRERIHTLVINADNGPENSGRRTQWLKRLIEFSDCHGIHIQLAYYPPYHSKYNPVERLWGILENHWRGELLETVKKTLGLARSMTYKGIRPVVRKVTRTYESGVTLSKQAMLDVEQRLERKSGLEPWFISIQPMADLG
ncbi:ISAzo13 family transposase [Magnetovirga frankeli]|uniref:ISAzo13 family transposase n=1 Tax=Magnetovirga frankeli TaxID=947516 RepID=UPI003D32AEBA